MNVAELAGENGAVPEDVASADSRKIREKALGETEVLEQDVG